VGTTSASTSSIAAILILHVGFEASKILGFAVKLSRGR
jgi:hypothetical protein